ncbi:MAG: hypothetical protein Terrestrivirus8_52 [Terrestrivirus sp.]|uniref:Uncharacterized protein n=1 Tax=Terrestrivirus sp. TaxID=2487775 RepID=A0A3G4ZSZ2_9VIRU|nr:MAG: hypothetical protein Terrestrivirus8_52 [Terrestrivirus sp.]
MESPKNSEDLPSYQEIENEQLRDKIKALESELMTQKEINKQLENQNKIKTLESELMTQKEINKQLENQNKQKDTDKQLESNKPDKQETKSDKIWSKRGGYYLGKTYYPEEWKERSLWDLQQELRTLSQY